MCGLRLVSSAYRLRGRVLSPGGTRSWRVAMFLLLVGSERLRRNGSMACRSTSTFLGLTLKSYWWRIALPVTVLDDRSTGPTGPVHGTTGENAGTPRVWLASMLCSRRHGRWPVAPASRKGRRNG